MSNDEKIEELIDERMQVYGDPVETFPRVAEIWSGILGHQVTATDVTLCMMGYKMLRTQLMPDYSDNSDDIVGYYEIFRRIVGDDMVHARSVEDYLLERRRLNGDTR